MCGIFGMSGTASTSVNDDTFLKNCALAGSVRGVHGTGLVFMEHQKKTTYLKRAMSGGEFVTDVFNPSEHMGNKTHSVIGHNRWATVGDINDNTAHPFVEAGVIGVHNGTLRGDWKGQLEVSRDCDVDSRGLYRAVAARGIDWVVSKLNGAAALVWTETREQRTFVWRNSERPLHYKESPTKVYYASEKGMLDWLLGKSNIYTIGETKAFKTNTLYEITGGHVVELRELKGVYSAPATKWVQGTASRRTTAASQQQGTASKANAQSQPTKAKSSSNKQETKKERRARRAQERAKQQQTPSEEKKRRTTGGTSEVGRDTPKRIYTRPVGDAVAYRGTNVSNQELTMGIVGEWKEVGPMETYECCCCDKPIIQPGFLESVNDSQFKLHHTCYDIYRAELEPTSKLLAIIRDPFNLNEDGVLEL